MVAVARGAFSLVELIAVLVIVGVMAAVAAPALTPTTSARSAMVAKTVARDVAYARERAISTGTGCWVVVVTASNSYSILQENCASPGRAGATVTTDPATPGRNFVQTLNTGERAGVTITSVNLDGTAEVGFDWRGKPYNASSVALSSQGVIGLSGGWSVRVEAGSGFVTATTP
ncbi:MAG: Tfp pilus assembly protein FimT/FimU [Phycisphaerales bacterium]